MPTSRTEEQDSFYYELCEKYGENHTWNTLTEDEKNRWRSLDGR